MDFSDLNFNILHFERLPSSNIHAQQMMKGGELNPGDVIWTDFQEEGKGQKGSIWASNATDNLLLSVFLQTDIPVEKIFILNKLASLSVFDLLDRLAVEDVRIKWPNDILVNGQKICGILIENSIQGNRTRQSLIGIGLNLNQSDFPEFDRPATSLVNELGEKVDRQKILDWLLRELKNRLIQFQKDPNSIHEDYLSRFYGLDQTLRFKTDTENFEAKVIGIEQEGSLVLDVEGGKRSFGVKEVRFID